MQVELLPSWHSLNLPHKILPPGESLGSPILDATKSAQANKSFNHFRRRSLDLRFRSGTSLRIKCQMTWKWRICFIKKIWSPTRCSNVLPYTSGSLLSFSLSFFFKIWIKIRIFLTLNRYFLSKSWSWAKFRTKCHLFPNKIVISTRIAWCIPFSLFLLLYSEYKMQR